MQNIANPFVKDEEAFRYHNFRPVYHQIPFTEINRIIGQKIGTALDVACGTGHSTSELAKICNSVVGCDNSISMLKQAQRFNPGIRFEFSPGETTPFESKTFDLINISMGIHWLDQEVFLKEAKRLLHPRGYLNVDNYWFASSIVGIEKFESFHREFYARQFPAPKRGANYPGEEITASLGFRLVKDIFYEHSVHMTLPQFVGFLRTQSNVQLHHSNDPDAAEKLLTETYEQFFGGSSHELCFKGLSKLYQLAN